MKIAIAQKSVGKGGRRLVAFFDNQWLVYDPAAKELSFRPGFRVPGVVCFERAGLLADWQVKHIIFDPNSYLPVEIPIENYLHPWIEAGIRLALSDFKVTPKKGNSHAVLSLGRDKPLYELVWKRWRIWQTPEHREKMKSYTIAVGAHEDLLSAFAAEPAIKGITPKQVTDACNRLGLPLLSR